MSKENKFRANSKYFTIAAYAFGLIAIASLLIKVIFFWDDASSFMKNLISTLEPFFLGILIAFLINPLVNWMRRVLFGKVIHIKKPGLNNALSILLSYIVVLTAIILAILFIIPSIIGTVKQLAGQLGELRNTVSGITHWIDGKFSGLNLTEQVNAFLTKKHLLKMLGDFFSQNSSSLLQAGASLAATIINIVIAFIVSAYLIIDKKVQTRSIKRIIYAFFEERRAAKICYVSKRAVSIFSGFFDGKMLDSLVMGIITYVSMLIMGIFFKGFISNALLIAILIGVTNMIPYFGPFIGAVPSILILLVSSGWQGALVFTIYIIVIMQVDGNIIGPKILGGSTGLRPLWIIFAITIGGWAFGVVGMLIGVPIVATITGLLNDTVEIKLDKKGIDMPSLDRPTTPEKLEELKALEKED